MPIEDVISTPQARLAASREALTAQLYGREKAIKVGRSNAREPLPSSAVQSHRRITDQFPWAAMGRNVAKRWWRRHPLNAAGQLGRPLVERYARRQPAKFVAVAATVGALIVLIKPWRLLSITAVVAAVLKTSDIADMVTSLLTRAGGQRLEDH